MGSSRSPSEVRQRSPVALLRVLLISSLLLPILLFAGFAWVNYWSAIERAQEDLRRASQVGREHASRVMGGQAQVAARVAELVRGMSDGQIRSTEASLHGAMDRIVDLSPDISSVMLVSRAGHPLASARVFPVPAELDLSDRDYFREAPTGFSGTFVSKPQIGAVSHRPFLSFARSREPPDDGLIDVGVVPSVFQEFYRTVLEGEDPGRVLMLARGDGEVLSRYSTARTDPPVSGVGAGFLQNIAENPDNGSYIGPATKDAGSPENLFAYERVPGYTLYVVAAMSRAAIIAGWARSVAAHLVFGLPATLALFAVTATALRWTRQREELLAQLEAEMARREAAEAALLRRQRLDAVGQMTGGIAHDFNNLLTVVLGNLALLEKRPDDPVAVRRRAAIALTAAQRGSELTKKLLAFSRRQHISPEIVSPNRQLREFKQVLEQAAAPSLVELSLADDVAAVWLDPGQFETALLNLVVNARDATEPPGVITISTSHFAIDATDWSDLPAGRYVRIAVSDTGRGMDAGTVARAFEPFFTTKEIGGGTGLGLSQVYGFARQAGGDVRIISASGQGTTVEILLPPTNIPADETTDRSDPAAAGQAPDGEVVLVVEDEPDVRELALESLRELGYQTLSAANAREALDRLRQPGRIDVLFSDVMMPGDMDGVKLAAAARGLRPGLKVLLASGYAPSVFGQRVPDDIPLLTKPYDQAVLAARLSALSGKVASASQGIRADT